MSNIIEGSKLIAEYMGWKYIPFNDLQGFPKAGWYEVEIIEPHMIKVRIPDGNGGSKESEIDVSLMRFSKKGWSKRGNQATKYVCRNHSDLRFYNSLDTLLPVIEKLEKEDLKEYFYKWEMYGETEWNFNRISFGISTYGCYSEIELDLDPPIDISRNYEDLRCVQNTFNCVVETIKYVNKVKSEEI